MLSDDARKWCEQQNNEFMHAFAAYFDDNEAREYCDIDDSYEGETTENLAGWYSRLSAPGYLDCTDWQGPYATEDEAFQGLYDTYGDD